jgi:hypothetical protein
MVILRIPYNRFFIAMLVVCILLATSAAGIEVGNQFPLGVGNSIHMGNQFPLGVGNSIHMGNQFPLGEQRAVQTPQQGVTAPVKQQEAIEVPQQEVIPPAEQPDNSSLVKEGQTVTAPENQQPAKPVLRNYLGQQVMHLGQKANGIFQKVFHIG